jgi:hypothetical protein
MPYHVVGRAGVEGRVAKDFFCDFHASGVTAQACFFTQPFSGRYQGQLFDISTCLRGLGGWGSIVHSHLQGACYTRGWGLPWGGAAWGGRGGALTFTCTCTRAGHYQQRSVAVAHVLLLCQKLGAWVAEG